MNCLVDTCIWSEVLRKPAGGPRIKSQFSDLVLNSQVHIIGPIRQETVAVRYDIPIFTADRDF